MTKGISAGIPAMFSGWFENIDLADVLEVSKTSPGAHQVVSDAVTNCLDWATPFHEQDVKDWERRLLDTITIRPGVVKAASDELSHSQEHERELLRNKDKMIEILSENLTVL